ncbi:MAG: LptF/LptG family permease [Psychrilyobacter sp.]|nr:LptF/LptG family permease [Psychrilyobacter sp.]
MKIIYKYLFKQLKMPIIFGISLFTFVFLIELMVKMMESILVKKVPALEMLHLLTYYIPPILSQTIPIGFFLGVMITYNKLTSTSESVAMVSIGMSLNKILKVPFFMSIGIFVLTIFLQEKIIPESFIRAQRLAAEIATETPAFQLTEKTFLENIGGYSIYINTLDPKTNQANNVVVFQKNNDSEYPSVLLSKSTTWGDGAMTLKDASFYQLDELGKEKLRGSFKSQVHPLGDLISDMDISIKAIDTMSVKMLLKNIKELKSKNEEPEKILPYRVELQKKLAAPFSSIFLGVLGVLFSLGHHRSGKSVSYGLSMGVVFLYITLFNVGIVLSGKGMVTPILGIWIPNILLAVLTGVMYARKVRRG